MINKFLLTEYSVVNGANPLCSFKSKLFSVVIPPTSATGNMAPLWSGMFPGTVNHNGASLKNFPAKAILTDSLHGSPSILSKQNRARGESDTAPARSFPALTLLKASFERSIPVKSGATFGKSSATPGISSETAGTNTESPGTSSASRCGSFATRRESSARVESGSARVESTSARVESGSARVESTSARPESGSARVESTSARVESGGARVESTSARPESGSARVESTSARPESGSARVESTRARLFTPFNSPRVNYQGYSKKHNIKTIRIKGEQ